MGQSGDMPITAAMRAVVAFFLGLEVEVPDNLELLK